MGGDPEPFIEVHPQKAGHPAEGFSFRDQERKEFSRSAKGSIAIQAEYS